MKKLILTLMLAASVAANASKVQPGLHDIRQSDGTTIRVAGFGDEHFAYYTTEDGTILYHSGNDFFVAKVAADGSITSTGILAHEPAIRSAKEKAAIATQDRTAFLGYARKTAKAKRVMQRALIDENLTPHMGKPEILVILAEFNDVGFSIANPNATFSKLLNSEELFNTTDDADMASNYGSVRRYFKDMSKGAFSPEFKVYGPAKLPHDMKYYGASENMKALTEDACTAMDSEIDFSKYDTDGDGFIDLVYIIYAGYSEGTLGNSTDCIWPKSGVIGSSDLKFDGVAIRRYGVNNEMYGTPATQDANNPTITGIGVMCHEFSHCMGLPDFYPTPGSVAEKMVNHNMEYFDLMDGGEHTMNGFVPTAYTAWEKEQFGWCDIEDLNEPDNIEMRTLDDGGKAYRIKNDNDPTGNEYYILENIQKQNWNKRSLAHGLMVTHVDYNESDFKLSANSVNNTPGHPRMTLIPADGLLVPVIYTSMTSVTESDNEMVKAWNEAFVEKYNGQAFSATMYRTEAAGDMFPGKAKVTELTDTSSPTKATVYTSEPLGKPITDIAEDKETGTVTFKFMGGKTDGIKDVNASGDKPHGVYSIYGTRMGKDLTGLQPGIYIVDGKKVLKK